METISFKSVYPKGYIKKMQELPKEAQQERVKSAKECVRYLKNGLANKRFDSAWEHLALARLLRENNLKKFLERELRLKEESQ